MLDDFDLDLFKDEELELDNDEHISTQETFTENKKEINIHVDKSENIFFKNKLSLLKVF